MAETCTLPHGSSGAGHRKPSFHGIAALARVSASTVDRVLNGRGNVSADIRQRVITAARELGAQRLLPPVVDRTLRINVVIPALGRAYEERLHLSVETARTSFALPIEVDVIAWPVTGARSLRTHMLSDQNRGCPMIVIGLQDAVLQQISLAKCDEGTPVAAIDCVMVERTGSQAVGEDPMQSARLARDLCTMWDAAPGDVLVLSTTHAGSVQRARHAAFNRCMSVCGDGKAMELLIGGQGDDSCRIAEAISAAMPKVVYSLLPGNGWIERLLDDGTERGRPSVLVHDCTPQHLRLLQEGLVDAVLEVDINAQVRYAFASILNELGESFPAVPPCGTTEVVLRGNSAAFAARYRSTNGGGFTSDPAGLTCRPLRPLRRG